MKRILPVLFAMTIAHLSVNAQTETYAEKLGFPVGKKFVVFHVDDAGMSYESNAGTMNALDKGIANSTSVMMPCGWVPHFFDYLKKHPTVDAGVHLTLTSEWKNYRWQPLSGCSKVPGLCDEQGALWRTVEQVVQHASLAEVETEIRAQLARYREFGIQPTHMDSHMGTLFEPKFLPAYIKVAMEEKVPILFPGGHASFIMAARPLPADQQQMIRQLGEQLWNAGLPVFDDIDASSSGWKLPAGLSPTDENLRKNQTQKLIESLRVIKPGLTYVILHCTDPSPTFDQISGSGPGRKGDMLAMMDPALRSFIVKEGIILTTWRELTERRANVK